MIREITPVERVKERERRTGGYSRGQGERESRMVRESVPEELTGD